MAKGLTKRQEEILDFIVERVRDFVPASAVYELSGLSVKALPYMGDLANLVRTNGYAQLPTQVFAKARRRRQKLFKRRPLGDFSLLRLSTVAARVEVLVEEASNVKLIEDIGRFLLRDFLHFRF